MADLGKSEGERAKSGNPVEASGQANSSRRREKVRAMRKIASREITGMTWWVINCGVQWMWWGRVVGREG